jgi:hypothetical protein
MLRTGRLPAPFKGRFPALRTPALTDARRVRYRRPWRLCGPDFHRLATPGFTLGYPIPLPPWAQSPSYWTHT